MNQSNLPTIILGGGFTGLFTALHLCHQQHPRPIVLIDQAERFVFKPLLYELLSGEMTANQVWPRYAELLDCDAIAFVQGIVRDIDLHQRLVKLASGLCYEYGHLVLALGSAASYFGIEGAKDHAFAFRTGDDAVALGKHLRECLQRASQTKDPIQRRALLTVAVIGAGPAGVEMAATLGDLLPQWYRKLDGNLRELRVVILNRGQDILKGDINSQLRETAQKSLQQRVVPVELIPQASAEAISPEGIEYKQRDQLKTLLAATVIWTAGNAVHPLIKALPIPEQQRDRGGRLRVPLTLQSPNFPEVFAGGDCTVLDDPLPSTAQVAYQQGYAIAYNLNALVQSNPLKPAKVSLRGTLMKLGLREGAANLFDRFAITGRPGHLIRHGAYLELIPSPVHNFKATVEWLTDEIFQTHSPIVSKSKPPSPRLQWASSTAIALVVISSGLLFWRTVQPHQFERILQPTGLPSLLNRLEAGG